MYKCEGCGAILQNKNINDVGYTTDVTNKLCERCFRIRNYNEYKIVVKDNEDYIKILKDISKTSSLVILVVDVFNISSHLNDINKYLTNDILLVLTKRDILPKSCYDKKFLEYFNLYNLNIVDRVIISSKNNYNYDELYNKINKNKKNKNVYVVGFTNAGKSTLINRIIYNYSNNQTVITTSNLPSTTIDSINVKINEELELIDTPGLLDSGDIINYVDKSTLKKIIPNKEIKPITYQVSKKNIFIIDDILRLDVEDTNITFYISNNINIRRIYKDNENYKNLKKYEFNVYENSDIVIQGLGFINISKKCSIVIYVKEGVSVFTRKELI